MPGQTSRLNGQKGGRPKGSENSDTKARREMRKRWLDRVYEEADKIFEAQLDLALGYYREVDLHNGSIRLYERPPNGKAIQ